jgi:two-component system response regulator RegX3
MSPHVEDCPVALVVDDDEAARLMTRIALEQAGFRVLEADDGLPALAILRSQQVDIVLLDVMLPKISGTDVCREIRKKSQVPIIMVSAKGSEIDTVVGLEVGADDYIVKPYRLRELVARIRAALRRSSLTPNEIEEVGLGTVSIGDVSIDPEQHIVTVRGEVAKLPLKEFELLYVLMANAGRVLTRETLIDRVWGTDYYGDTKTLDVHIKRLRSKVELDPAVPTRVATIRGLGYKYEKVVA